MISLDVPIGVVLNLLAMGAIGLGPALAVFPYQKRLLLALNVAPALGFAITSIIGTWLIVLDKPVDEWAGPYLVLAAAMSLAVSFAIVVSHRNILTPSVDGHAIALSAGGLLLTAALVLAPVGIGGLTFTILRGNGTDSFNYITMAGYLDHEPYSWVSQASLQALIDRHPSYELARQLLTTRWTTSAMLAWTSRIVQVPPYRFEYGYSVLFFLLAFGPAFCLAVMARVRPFLAFLSGAAVAAGFWAQWVVDIRAMSQMSSIPVLLLLAVLFARIEDQPMAPAGGERILLGIVGAGLFLLYPEVVPMAALGLAVFFAARLLWNPGSVRHASRHLFSLGIAAVATLPAAQLLAHFFLGQLGYAQNGQNNWYQAYFAWLYSVPVIGAWGLSLLSSSSLLGSLLSPIGLKAASLLLGFLLSLILSCSIIRAFSRKGSPAATLLVASLAVAALIQFAFLVSKGQLWAAGKGLSFGYPFIMISVVSLTPAIGQLPRFRWRSALATVAKVTVGLWLVIQCSLGAYRIAHVAVGREYSNYITQHFEYRRHDWNVAPFSEVLQQTKQATVWQSVYDPWLSEYLGFALGWDAHLVNLDGIRDRSGAVAGHQTLSGPLQYFLTDKNGWWDRKRDSKYIVSQNSELVLLKVSQDFWNDLRLLNLHNPNGLETDSQGVRSFWLGGGPTAILLYSPTNGYVAFEGQFTMGPSLPERSYREITVQSDPASFAQALTVREDTQGIRLPVHQGLNEVSIQVDDQPSLSVLPNGDTRPLLLWIHDLTFHLEQDSPKDPAATPK